MQKCLYAQTHTGTHTHSHLLQLNFANFSHATVNKIQSTPYFHLLSSSCDLPKCQCLHIVNAWCKQTPVFAAFCRAYRLILYAGDQDICISNWITTSIRNQTFHADMTQFQQLHQTALVACPFGGQRVGSRILTARQLNGHFETIGEGIIEILHATI